VDEGMVIALDKPSNTRDIQEHPNTFQKLPKKHSKSLKIKKKMRR